jgi:integrase
MANLGRKGEIYLARFRYRGKEYKKSLKTSNLGDARAAMNGVERAIHGLTIGLIRVPEGVDPGDFIISGGTVSEALLPRHRALPLATLVEEYLANQRHKASSSVYTEGIHLKNLLRYLGRRSEGPADRIQHRDLDQFLQARLRTRKPSTAHKERETIIQLFRWLVAHGYLRTSPATGLTAIKGEVDLAAFRTMTEIEAMLARGGLGEIEALRLWDCIYLTPTEIADLLGTVRTRAESDVGFLLHVVPAYTGMRRGEVLRLRWSDVELDQRLIVARSRKQSRRAVETQRRIDLHPELASELSSWRDRRAQGQYVLCEDEVHLPLDPDRANRAFWQPMRGTSWCLESKRNRFKVGFHTYRHSFASNLAAAGVDQRIIDEFMGHTTEAMRRRYRHLFPKDKRSAIESFSLAFGK